MLLIGKDKQQVELKILGYQFPNKLGDKWDSNWLRVYLNVKSKVGHWQTIDPSLTTGEFDDLREWFESLSQDIEVETKMVC